MPEIMKELEVFTESDFRRLVASEHPRAVIVIEDGSGITYVEIGSLTAVIGPDMQSDVVGVFVPEDDWGWILGRSEIG